MKDMKKTDEKIAQDIMSLLCHFFCMFEELSYFVEVILIDRCPEFLWMIL